MGSPYTNIYAIGEDHFAEFDERLQAVKSSFTLSAWNGFLTRYDYYPDDNVKWLVDRGAVVDGVEPDWFDETLVAVLKGAFIKGCPETRTEPNLIQDMWFFRYKWVKTLHSVCTTHEEHLQGCLLRMLLFDRYVLQAALKKVKNERLPGPLPRRKAWHAWFMENHRSVDKDFVGRDEASRVAFHFRYPLCFLCSIADESLLARDQTEQLVRAAADGGILGRCAQALPEGSEIERDDLGRIDRFLRDLAEPYPYLYAIAYGT